MSAADRLGQAKRYLALRGLSSSWDAVSERARRPGSAVLAGFARARAAANHPGAKAAAPRRQAREFSAGGRGPYTSGWDTSDRPINASLLASLRTMRGRSNWLARNSEYGNAYLRILRTNIVGPQGFTLQYQAKTRDGTLDTPANAALERAFALWSRAEHCDFVGECSWLDLQNVWINTVARDGEILTRRHFGRGAFGYQLQFLDPALLDETYHANLDNGNKVRMSIERDPDGRRVAYWLSQTDRADPRLGGLLFSGGKRVRIPAEEIWHDFLPLWVGQLRGVPWMAAGMIREHRLEEFELAALAAAEEGAKKLAWITTPSGTLHAQADAVAENKKADAESNGAPVEADVPKGYTSPQGGTLYTNSDQGIHYANLPPGATVTPYSANYPDEAVSEFVNSALKGLAAGWGVPHHALSGNLEGVNFATGKISKKEAEDYWVALQNFMIERLCQRVSREWLPYAMLAGQVPYSVRELDRLDAAEWHGRRWESTQPEKDAAAQEIRLRLGITSRQREIRAAGLDPDTIRAERLADAQADHDNPEAAPAGPRPAAIPAAEPPEPDGDDTEEDAPE